MTLHRSGTGKKELLRYLAKFLLAFAGLYYGTQLVIGLASPGGYYSVFVAQYLDYVAWLRSGLLHASRILLGWFGYHTYLADPYILRLEGGRGVRMVYSCLGYGIMSFWLAFVFANAGSTVRKACWMTGGVVMICIINIIRISLLLLSNNHATAIFFRVNHHTFFNFAAYTLVFGMIWLYDWTGRKKKP